MVLLELGILAFSLLLIYKSSEWVITYADSLSRILGISALVIGFILVALATSLPEIFVTVFATLESDANLAVGNILGSNMFNINVIIGITTFLSGTIFMRRQETLHMIELLFITTVITLVILSFPTLNVVHGIALMVLFGYVISKLYKGGKIEKVIAEEIPLLEKKGIFGFLRKEKPVPVFLKFGFSIAVLLLGSKLLVDASVVLAEAAGLSTLLIGATIVAVGTSLPELAVTLAAVKKKRYALAMGDIIGSAVTNITLVLGLLAVINGGALQTVQIVGMLPFLILSTVYILYVFSQKRKVTTFEGAILLLIYFVFVLEQFQIFTLFS